MQSAAVDGQQVVLLLEDHQFVHLSFLEMVNSLLSSGQLLSTLCVTLFATYSVIRKSFLMFTTGEVPGLYSTEELEPLLSSLKDQASQDGFTGPVLNYFSHRKYTHAYTHLHTIALMFHKPSQQVYFAFLYCFISYCSISVAHTI